jgi:hypothetical protein
MRARTPLLWTLLWLSIALSPRLAPTYDLAVHRAVTLRAAQPDASDLDAALQGLGFAQGKSTLLTVAASEAGSALTQRAEFWLRDGAAFEDQPDLRVMNHFHNPLRIWEDAGLRVVIQLGQSSVLWQQNPDQDGAVVYVPFAVRVGGGSWSWQLTRQRFADALTSSARAAREQRLAEALQGLGHAAHLLQDGSVPAHVRNDPHLYKTLFGFDIGTPDGYERWVDRRNDTQLNRFLSQPAVAPDHSIFTPTGSAAAPVPIARLIDADRYDGTNPDILVGAEVGLAEYTNGNFFSNDTVFVDREVLFGRIPYPARTSVDVYAEEIAPGTKRRYLRKVRDGETNGGAGYKLAVVSALDEATREERKRNAIGLDPTIHEEYAGFLLPRAVGYTAALIDYFFRGRLAASVDGQQVQVVNQTPDEGMEGDFTLFYDTEDGTRTPLATWRLSLGSGEASQALESAPVPDDLVATVTCLLVFRGRLLAASGAEERDAVAGQVTACPVAAPLPPPPPPPPEPFPEPVFMYDLYLIDNIPWSVPCGWDPQAWVDYFFGQHFPIHSVTRLTHYCAV